MNIYSELLEAFLFQKMEEHQPSDLPLAFERHFWKEEGKDRARIYNFFEELQLTPEKFEEIYFNPLKRLNSTQMAELVGYWNMGLGVSNGWTLTFNHHKLYDTLRWLLFRLHLLGITQLELYSVDFDDHKPSGGTYEKDKFDLEALQRQTFWEHSRGLPDIYLLGEKYGKPYKQCLFCGRLDADRR
jgi:hypothetical protein